MRNLLAELFRNLFKIPFFRKRYFGFHQHIFNPYQLFVSVKKQIVYRENIRLQVHLSDWIQQQLYFLGDYEKPEIDYLSDFLKPGDVFIDIGANIGLFSFNASKIVGDEGKIYAFEAFPPNYKQFKENILLNKFENIITENKAISSQNSTMEIFYNEKDNNIGMASAFLKNFTSKEIVESTTLDQYSEDHHIDKINLIKIDIEGGEYDALLGMNRILTELKPHILIEINHKTLLDSGHSEMEIINLLSKFNYKILKKLSSDEQSYNAVFGFQN